MVTMLAGYKITKIPLTVSMFIGKLCAKNRKVFPLHFFCVQTTLSIRSLITRIRENDLKRCIMSVRPVIGDVTSKRNTMQTRNMYACGVIFVIHFCILSFCINGEKCVGYFSEVCIFRP